MFDRDVYCLRIGNINCIICFLCYFMKILRNFYLLAFLPVLVLLTDLLVRQDILLQFNSRMRGYYLLSIAGSFLFYLFILLFLNQIARKIPKAVSYFLAFLIAIVYSFSLIGYIKLILKSCIECNDRK